MRTLALTMSLLSMSALAGCLDADAGGDPHYEELWMWSTRVAVFCGPPRDDGTFEVQLAVAFSNGPLGYPTRLEGPLVDEQGAPTEAGTTAIDRITATMTAREKARFWRSVFPGDDGMPEASWPAPWEELMWAEMPDAFL